MSLLLCDVVNSALSSFHIICQSLKQKQVTKTQISSPSVLNMKFTANFLQSIIGLNMTKILSRKANGTMETYVNFARFFVTVLENRKKLCFVEVDRCVSCSVFS